jgi:hypothetical protein
VNTLIMFMFWLIFIAIGATVIAFYMDAYDNLPVEEESDPEWENILSVIRAAETDMQSRRT